MDIRKYLEMGVSLPLGISGENGIESYEFGYGDWASSYGDGVLSINHQRPGDSTPYPVGLTVSGHIAHWNVTAADVQYSGHGRIQVVYAVNGIMKKTMEGTTIVEHSLGENVGADPAIQSYIDTMVEIKDEAYQSMVTAVNAKDVAVQKAQDVLGLTAEASITGDVGTPSVSVELTTEDDHKNLNFSFANLKGETGYPTEEQIADAVDDWLVDHPEATTTVEDGSVTLAKLASDIHDDVESIRYAHTVNLFDPINKSGTVDGITYTFKNGTLRMAGTKTGWVKIQTLTASVDDVFTISSMARSAKPSIYVRDDGTNIATFAQADGYVQFTMPTTSVDISAYMSGTFDFTFSLTIVKNEIPSFPLLLHENGQNTIKNFVDCTYEAIGDSLTYGFTGSWDQGQQVRVHTPYPDVIKDILGFKAALNKGETGTTIANDLDKMGTYYPISNDNRLSGYSYAQVISVMGGTNDFTKGTALGTRYDNQSLSTFHAGWKRILSNLVGRFSPYDAFIFVIIPPVTQALFTDNSAGVKWVDYINATIEECRNYGVPVLDMSIMGRLTDANKTVYTSDGIHFNQKYITRIFAPTVAEFIKQYCF